MYLFLLFVTCLVTVQSVVLSKPHFKNIIAFGDSYTDNGSFSKFYASGSFRIDKSSLSPSTSETSRYSDDLLWVEYLAGLLDNAQLFDFARSGATANNTFINRGVQDMSTQIDAYIKAKAPTEDSIYFLWIGVNDIFELFNKYPTNNITRQNILNGTVHSIRQDLTRLYQSGADHIMLMGLIPLETAIIYKDVPTEFKYQLKELVADYNKRLNETMTAFQHEYPKASSSFYDMHTLFQNIVDQSGVNAEVDCSMGLHCKDLVWWDYLHPASSTHLKIANAMYESILEKNW